MESNSDALREVQYILKACLLQNAMNAPRSPESQRRPRPQTKNTFYSSPLPVQSARSPSHQQHAGYPRKRADQTQLGDEQASLPFRLLRELRLRL